MSRLMPNPLGDMLQPLLRVEKAIARLADELEPIDSLPPIHDELRKVNETLLLLLDELRSMREEQPAPRPPGAKSTKG